MNSTFNNLTFRPGMKISKVEINSNSSYIFKKVLLAHNIGYNMHPNYNTREELLEWSRNNLNATITFDGIYRNVFENKDIIQEILTRNEIILFVTGTYVGGYNTFDKPEIPFERFADWNQIMDLVYMGCKLGWHTWNHPYIYELSDQAIKKEITPPFPMDYFAYPYGIFNDEIIKMIKECGFKKAYTVFDGDNSDYQLTRVMI